MLGKGPTGVKLPPLLWPLLWLQIIFTLLDKVMSDKFFFKGRQDARQSHIKYGYETQAKPRSGSQKYPLQLVVTSEARQLEVAAQVAEAQLFADIEIDTRDGAVESIGELTVLLNKPAAVTVTKTPARNEPCSCGSGKKFKQCCA